MFTDSHCHLNFPELAQRLPDVLAAMQAAQVTRALCISTTMEEFPAVRALAAAHPHIWASVGVHPDSEGVQEPAVADLLAAAALPRVVAVGETGLDYYQLAERKGGRSVAQLQWQRDRFRTRMERNASGGTDIYVTHRGMEEVYNSSHKDSTVWQPRASDVELETEFLRRLMLRLGATQEQAQAAKAAAQAQEAQAASSGPALAALTQAGGQPVIQVGENFDRAWRAIGLALDRAGFTVEDRDRSKGAYYVRYAEPDAPRPKQGWLDRILNRSAAAIPTTQYQLIIQEQGGSSFVRALSESGAPLDAATAEKLLKLIAAETR